MSSRKYNASKTYLLPLLSELVDIDSRFINELQNTFMFDEDNEYGECLHILHEFNFRDPDFTSYEHKLLNNELFVRHIDMKDKVLYTFKFPEEYLNEYYLLQNSKYSEFGKDAKELILKFWTEMYGKVPGGINVILKVKQILYKDNKLKKQLEDKLSSAKHRVVIPDDQELGEAVNLKNEIFRLNAIEES
jgi:hypothetical protein